MLGHMGPKGEPGGQGRWDSGDMQEIRADALDVVTDALQWRLAEERWQKIEDILTAMDGALENGDANAIAATTADLELAGPLRIILIGPAAGPTPVARDLLNKMVHSLGGVTVQEPEDPAQEPGDAGAGDAGASRG
jgi:CATRA-Associated Small Protein